MRFDNKINRLLMEKNITQRELAEMAGYNASYVSSVILGHQHSKRAQYRIAKILGKPISELWPKRNGARKKAVKRNGQTSR